MTELNKGEGMQVCSSGSLISSVEGAEISIGEVIEKLQNRIASLETTLTTQNAKIDTLIEMVNYQSDKIADLSVRTEINLK